MKEYETDLTIEIEISAKSMGKLDVKGLKTKITKILEDKFEADNNVCEYDVWDFRFEKMEEENEE